MQTTAPETTFEWSVFPARERPALALAAIFVIVALSAAAQELAGSSLAGMLAACVLILSLRRFFFPTHYMFDASGLVARPLLGRRRLQWQAVRRVEAGVHAAWLSPLEHPSWRDSHSGVLLLFGRHADAVREELIRRLPAELSAPLRTRTAQDPAQPA